MFAILALVEQALTAYKLGASIAVGEEASNGTLQTSMQADLVILDRDPRQTLLPISTTCKPLWLARLCIRAKFDYHISPLLRIIALHPIFANIGLLIISNIFMTFAWYAHLKNLNNKPWIIAALVSWGIALLEYLFQVPANRIGYTVLSLGQLKVIQEVVTLSVFVPFAFFYMKEPLKLDYLWAGCCLVGAVYFMFRAP